MTIGEFVKQKLEEYQLEKVMINHNSDYTCVTIRSLGNSINAENFAKFVAEAELVGIRGNADGSITCWF